MDNKTIARGLWILKEAYPDRYTEISESMVEAWTSLMSDVAPADFEYSIKHIAHNGAGFPSAQDVRLKAIMRHRPFKSPQEIWAKILECARKGLTFVELSPVFHGDPAILPAIQALGWDLIRYHTTDEQMSYRKHDFLNAYKEMTERNEGILLELTMDAERNQGRQPLTSIQIRKIETQVLSLYDQLIAEGKKPMDAFVTIWKQLNRLIEARAHKEIEGPTQIGDIIADIKPQSEHETHDQ